MLFFKAIEQRFNYTKGDKSMREKAPPNSHAIVSLVLGVLSILMPLVGIVREAMEIIFSIKARKEMNQKNEDDKGLATTGMICSVAGVIIQLLVVLIVLSISFFRLS